MEDDEISNRLTSMVDELLEISISLKKRERDAQIVTLAVRNSLALVESLDSGGESALKNHIENVVVAGGEELNGE